jgi:hypothetical protein
MATYITWPDVQSVYPEASSVVSATATQAEIMALASSIVDRHLSKIMPTPLEPDSDGVYDAIAVQATACIAADLVAYRRIRGRDDLYSETYLERSFTGTVHGHRGMGLIEAIVEGAAPLDEAVTEGEVRAPRVAGSLSTTDGTLRGRFGGGRFIGETERSFVVTITSAGGTIAAGTLTVTIVMDGLETILEDYTIADTNWLQVKDGLELQFIDGTAWTQNEYWTVTCYPPESKTVPGAIRSIEVPIG